MFGAVFSLVLLLTNSGQAQDIVGFRRGDCNGDTVVDIGDAIFQLQELFASGPASLCDDACDANDDGLDDIADPVALLALLFNSSAPLPPPHASCGEDPTADPLDCAQPTCIIATITSERAHSLATGRVGLTYASSLPALFEREVTVTSSGTTSVLQEQVAFDAFGVMPGHSLPAGLILDPDTGALDGIPGVAGFFSIDCWARREGSLEAVRVHADLALFSPDDSECIPGQDFMVSGPYPVTTQELTFLYEHQLPWPPPYPLWQCNPTAPPSSTFASSKELRVYTPTGAPGPLPVVIFHHGTNFDHHSYNNVLSHLASYGVLCVSVNDPYSYDIFPTYYCWGGHEEGAQVLVAARQHLDQLVAAVPPIIPTFDSERVFYAGHSRGGASAIIAAELDPAVRGVIALQPTDAKGDSFIGNTNRWELLPACPLLMVVVEQDTDVMFPWADRLLERAAGATAMVTLFGGCHGYTTDSGTAGCLSCPWDQTPSSVDSCLYIDRGLQQALTRQFMVAFLKRHGAGDLSTDGILYGDEYLTSPLVAVGNDRLCGGALMVDDFRHYPLNARGGQTSSSGGIFSVGACYDVLSVPPAPITAIDNLIVDVPPAPGQATYTSPLGSVQNPLDIGNRNALKFRIKNPDRLGLVDNFGFGWLNAGVRLVDAAGHSATLGLASYLPGILYHPQPTPPGTTVLLKYQRFFTVTIPLTAFTSQSQPTGQSLLLNQLLMLEFTWSTTTNTSAPARIAIDDIRFE